MGSAQTGTGKTAAFALPILTKLQKHGALRCLILEPTRELAAQVETAFRDYARFMDVEIGLVHGGVGFGGQREMLKSGVDVLVATPGRLLDYMEQGEIKLKTIQYLVLDEVDRMLDMGFLPQVRRIVEKCPKERQTLFFSATLPPEIATMTKWVLREPVVIEIGQRQMPASTVTHALYPVAKDQKYDLLEALLERTNYDSVIIFCSTKIMADRVAHRLKDQKHAVAVLACGSDAAGADRGAGGVQVRASTRCWWRRIWRRAGWISRGFARDQLRCAGASGGLRAPDRSDRACAERRRCFHDVNGGGTGCGACH